MTLIMMMLGMLLSDDCGNDERPKHETAEHHQENDENDVAAKTKDRNQ